MVALDSEFWAAIAGAVVGGVISLSVQMVALHAAKSERLEERKERHSRICPSGLRRLCGSGFEGTQ